MPAQSFLWRFALLQFALLCLFSAPVAAQSMFSIVPDSASFSGPQGGPFDPEDSRFTVTVSDSRLSAGCLVNVSTATESWLDVTPFHGDCSSGSFTFAASPTSLASALAVGNYRQTINISVSADRCGGLCSRQSAVVDLAVESISGPPQLSVNATVVALTDAAEPGDNGAFQVRLERPLNTALIVTYEVVGSATAGVDYQSLTNTAIIASGASVANIPVLVLDDQEVENDETVIVRLTGSLGAVGINVFVSGQAQIFIADNDETVSPAEAIVLIQSSSNAAEPASHGSFTIALSDPGAAPTVVQYQLDSSSSATPGVDFEGLSGSLLIPGGADSATITVTLIDDTEAEGDETVTISLLSASNNASIGNPGTATITIVDDEDSSGDVCTADPSLAADDPLCFSLLFGEPFPPDSPQAEVGAVIITTCDDAQGAGSQYEQDCSALLNAADNDDPGAVLALDQITDDSASIATDVAFNGIDNQLGNIAARLNALRQGSRGFSVAGLTVNIDGTVLTEAHFNSFYEALTGAGASADGGDSSFGRLGIFVTGDLSFGDKDATINVAGFDFSSRGVTAGLDYRFNDKFIAGAAFGFSRSDTEINADGGDLDADGYVVTAFGTYYRSEQFFIDGSFSFGRNDFSQSRSVRYELNPGTPAAVNVDQIFDASYEGHRFAIAAGAGYQFNQHGFTIIPTGRLRFISTSVDQFQEQAREDTADLDGSAWAVAIDSQRFESLSLTLGTQASYAWSQSWGVLQPFASFDWVHEFYQGNDKISGRFPAQPTDTFILPIDNIDRNYFNLGLGVSAQFTHGAAAFLSYRQLIGYDDLENYHINVGFRFEF